MATQIGRHHNYGSWMQSQYHELGGQHMVVDHNPIKFPPLSTLSLSVIRIQFLLIALQPLANLSLLYYLEILTWSHTWYLHLERVQLHNHIFTCLLGLQQDLDLKLVARTLLQQLHHLHYLHRYDLFNVGMETQGITFPSPLQQCCPQYFLFKQKG